MDGGEPGSLRTVMQATVILADAAAVADGKLYLLGGGWNVTGPEPSPSAIGLVVGVPWDQTNRRHHFELLLHDSDGQSVPALPDPDSPPVKIDGELEIGRPAGVAPGSAQNAAAAFNIGPLPLIPGRGYVWQLFINGETFDHWRLPFMVRPALPQPPG